ncbi:MAG: transcriptional activator NhaR [Myxococcales bacterium]|nr:transcriptional activator NhaR [Myxococcales bacterium]MCB9704122.1 transcriptional activator NhaR [Myxococcales bacterium]
MEWLNYHHLFYFWTVVRAGSITQAAAHLRLAQATISSQIKALEESLGEPLLVRAGRRLQPTAAGQVVFRYADEIFSLGRELREALAGRAVRPRPLTVGIADVLPKMLAHHLLAPVLAMDPPVQLVCRADKHDRLLGELAIHGVDLVLSDTPLDHTINIRGFNHLLGACGVALMASPRLGLQAAAFPACLDGAPFLLPGRGTVLRASLEQWFEEVEVTPRFVGVFDESALLKFFGSGGSGVFAVPAVVAAEVEESYRVRRLGECDMAVRERVYAITLERRVREPAVVAITAAAREIFGEG